MLLYNQQADPLAIVQCRETMCISLWGNLGSVTYLHTLGKNGLPMRKTWPVIRAASSLFPAAPTVKVMVLKWYIASF